MVGRTFEGWKFLPIIIFYFSNEINSQLVTQDLDMLPDCDLGAENVDFFLYNKKNRDGVIVDLNSETIPVERDKSVVFLVHGFTSEANTSQYLNLTYTMLDKYDINVFGVDWKEGACSSGGMSLTRILSYPAAMMNTRIVGEKISKFIGRLIKDYGLKLSDIILVGHSLGAHVAGFAGKDVQKQKLGTPHHILALDPAGPGFENNPCSQRICSTDTDFLQVFHTSYAFGMHREIGSIDFYFNGGRNQAECPLLERTTCSHGMAITYLTRILQDLDCSYIGKKWNRANFFAPKIICAEDTCSIPGPLASELPARGTFYVNTKDLPTYC